MPNNQIPKWLKPLHLLIPLHMSTLLVGLLSVAPKWACPPCLKSDRSTAPAAPVPRGHKVGLTAFGWSERSSAAATIVFFLPTELRASASTERGKEGRKASRDLRCNSFTFFRSLGAARRVRPTRPAVIHLLISLATVEYEEKRVEREMERGKERERENTREARGTCRYVCVRYGDPENIVRLSSPCSFSRNV